VIEAKADRGLATMNVPAKRRAAQEWPITSTPTRGAVDGCPTSVENPVPELTVQGSTQLVVPEVAEAPTVLGDGPYAVPLRTGFPLDLGSAWHHGDATKLSADGRLR